MEFAVEFNQVRATVDIELLIRPEQAELACDAAMALGFMIHNPAMSLHDGAIVIKRLVRPQPDWNDGVLVLDLLFVTEALGSVWEGRQLVESTVGRVRVVSLDGLATLKTISGRPQGSFGPERTGETRTASFPRYGTNACEPAIEKGGRGILAMSREMKPEAVGRRLTALAEVSQVAVALKKAGERSLPAPSLETLSKLTEAIRALRAKVGNVDESTTTS